MRRLLPAVLLLLCGCAALPILGALGLSRMSVSVPSELPFPDELSLDLAGQAGDKAKLANAVLGALGQESLEKRAGKALKQAATPLRRLAAERFKQELVNAQLFGSVVETGGNLGMAVSVGRWGLAYDDVNKSYKPVLDLEATLSEPRLGVLWRGRRSAAQLSADVAAQVGKLDIAALIAKPERYQDVMSLVAKDLSRQLMEDLRKDPPKL